MRTPRTWLLVSAVAVAAAACGTEPTVAPEEIGQTPTLSTTGAIVPTATTQAAGHHIVLLDGAGSPTAELEQAILDAGGRIRVTYEEVGALVVDGLSDEAAEALGGRTDLSSIARDLYVQFLPPPDEMIFERIEAPSLLNEQSGAAFFDQFQWNMRQIDADDAWLVSNQGGGAIVHVLDTGVDPHHQDLHGKVDLANSFSTLTAGSSPCGVADEQTLDDLNFHGTFVSALVSSNGIGIASVAPHATLRAGKVLNCAGFGSFHDVFAGVFQASAKGADVINMSIGALLLLTPELQPFLDLLQRGIDNAVARGTHVVASAGNSGINLDNHPELIHLPSMLDNITSVSATAPVNQMNFDAPATYTNTGIRGVDVAAPGGDLVAGGVLEDLIISACSSFVCGGINFYVLSAGTSFSAPLAAGASAVVESQLPGDQGAARLEQCLFRGAEKIDGKRISPIYGRGRINVLNSINHPGCG